MSLLTCRGCGAEIADDAVACPRRGEDDGDHVVGPSVSAVSEPVVLRDDPDPFVRYLRLLHARRLAVAHGMSDDTLAGIVEGLDARVREVCGRGFVTTPLVESAPLARALSLPAGCRVFAKDETGNVGGSHKGRHLFGLAVVGEARIRLGLLGGDVRLAIASCGNAALAAAIVARAWDKTLHVYIPVDANLRVVTALERLGAVIHISAREEGAVGDPCYGEFRAAVRRGFYPFCCQGPDNGLTVEGGETLAWEVKEGLAEREVTLGTVFVQVGGGALASAVALGFADGRVGGPAAPLPRLVAIQTAGAAPLRRAWERVVARAGAELGVDVRGEPPVVARRLAEHGDDPRLAAVLDDVARHRSDFMWPWETTPHSVAHGILDDETYDWLVVVRAMLRSGGYPVVVSEAQLLRASELARAVACVDADETGASGLAGLVEASERGWVAAGEASLVILSGARR